MLDCRPVKVMSNTLTRRRARIIQNCFLNILPLHPSRDFFWLHRVLSNLKMKRLFVNFNQPSGLSLSDDCFHLLRLDIFVQIPLAYTRSVLPYPLGNNSQYGNI